MYVRAGKHRLGGSAGLYRVSELCGNARVGVQVTSLRESWLLPVSAGQSVQEEGADRRDW